MTKAQSAQVEYLKRKLVTILGKNLEYKEFTVTENDYFVSVSAVVGYPNDEQNLLFLVRNRYHILIGKRGGLRARNKRGTWVRGWRAIYTAK